MFWVYKIKYLHYSMFQRRIVQHLAFWAVYFIITLFNELFLTSGFTETLTADFFLRTFSSELLLMMLKIGFTYLVLNYFLPRWLNSAHKLAVSLVMVVAILLFVLFYRATIQYVTWPFILQYTPDLNFQSQLARFLYSLLEVLQILGITITLKLMRKSIHTARQERDLVFEKKTVELIRLRAQVQPHFLFNMLNSIYSLSRQHPERTPDVIHKLSGLLRYMLRESGRKLVTLESELKIVNDFIELQQLRFDNRVQLIKALQIDNKQAAITPLLIFPLVENAFKHGVGSRADNPVIELRVTLQNNVLVAETRNAIIGHSVYDDSSSGIGQTNIERQLQILYNEHEFICKAEKNVYHAYMKINLNSYVEFEMPDN